MSGHDPTDTACDDVFSALIDKHPGMTSGCSDCMTLALIDVAMVLGNMLAMLRTKGVPEAEVNDIRASFDKKASETMDHVLPLMAADLAKASRGGSALN